MIFIDSLHKSYDKVKALNDVSLSISKGELFGLIGVNGAGKSTLLNILTGLLKPDQGRIAINGMDIGQYPIEIKKHITYVPEEPVLYEYLTGLEFLQFVGEIRGLKKDVLSERIQFWINEFSLNDKAHVLIADYSQGMKKKMSFIAAFLPEPDILLLDEPTNGLDPESLFNFKKHVQQLHEKGKTIVLSSHNLDTVEKLCKRIAIIHEGRILTCDSIDSLRNFYGKSENLETIFIDFIKNKSKNNSLDRVD